MKSTGESILFIDDLKDDQFYELYSRRKNVLEQISSNKAYKK
jgi:carbamoyl-phosphate synthase large subunit